MPASTEISLLLKGLENGDNKALGSLYAELYQELKHLARKQLQNSWGVETISTTALVNEAYLKLNKSDKLHIENKAHFFALAATAMRQILINYAQQKYAQKRGGDWLQVTYEDMSAPSQHKLEDLLAINQAVEEIRTIDERLAQLIELRFFAGMTESEVSDIFGVTERTLRRNWKKAKALLATILEPQPPA